MYVAVKGGESAILAAEAWLDQLRRDPLAPPHGIGQPVPETSKLLEALQPLPPGQLSLRLPLLVDRVMAEAGLYDRGLADLALRQSLGDPMEAVFLLRAYRSTLPRLGHSEPLRLAGMVVMRRISSIFKDLPGGQILGPSFDYTQRLLDMSLDEGGTSADGAQGVDVGGASPTSQEARAILARATTSQEGPMQRLAREGLLESCIPLPGDPAPVDITRNALRHPLPRSARLQLLARADEGWVLGMGYATQRGYANSHPFAGELRVGLVSVELVLPELDLPVQLGEVEMTECEMVSQFMGSGEAPPRFTRGMGLVLGHGERKAMAIALVDRSLRAEELGEAILHPTQDPEFVLPHGDSVEASGFVQHLKLPHYVTFEAEAAHLRSLQAQWRAGGGAIDADAESGIAQDATGGTDKGLA